MLDAAKLTILGTGLLGASIGLGLRAAGFKGTIVGYGRTLATLDRAVKRRCVDEATTDLAAALRHAQLVVLATPIGVIRELLAKIGALLVEGCVVTDVGSTKQCICDDAARGLPEPRNFVGSHPMAGSERHGPDEATADLFRGRVCILTPTATDATPAAVQRVESLWSTLGMRLAHKTPEEHDRLVAAISHLPHALAALLVDHAQRARALSVASTGFRDTTRIASGDPRVWLDIFLTNTHAVTAAIDELGLTLSTFRAAVQSRDSAAILALLDHAKQSRDAWVRGLEQGAPS